MSNVLSQLFVWVIRFLIILAASGCGQAHSQVLGGGEPIAIPFVRIILGLGGATIIAFLAALYLRRSPMSASGIFRGKGSHSQIDILEVKRVSPNASVILLSALGRQFLVMVGEGQCTVLREDELGETKGAMNVQDVD